MIMFKGMEHKVPGLNTASLPDLVFTVLFFFMIVTHMREEQVMVEYLTPQGTELEKLTKKSTTSHVYIGNPIERNGNDVIIQINDKVVVASDVERIIREERLKLKLEDREKMTICIKADKNVKMEVMAEIKQSLRRANALKVIYSTEENE